MSLHTAKIVWKSDSAASFQSKRYSRAHTWNFDGGIEVPASASPHVVRPPLSVENAVDPEEAFVASAASCHMLTFLWLAAKAGFVIGSYEDNATGELTKNSQGREWISKITLNPKITWEGEHLPTPQDLEDLHHSAHSECYIANSIKSEIIVNWN